MLQHWICSTAVGDEGFDRSLDRAGWARRREECVAWCPAPQCGAAARDSGVVLLTPGPGLSRGAPAEKIIGMDKHVPCCSVS